jgi:dynein light intermediate chain 1
MENKRKASVNQPVKSTNMWQEILREAMPKKDIENTNVFVFGDKMTGKRSLFRIMNRSVFSDDDSYKRLLQIDEESSRFGLVDYTFINIKNNSEEYSDIIGKLNIWIMNDLIDKEKILTFLKPENIINCICLIMVDLSRPWLLKQSLLKWVKFVKEVFDELISKLPEDKQEELRENVVKKIKLYQEPEIDEQGKFIKKTLEEDQIKIKLNTPLKEGVLNTNCGVPIVFVINKSDVVTQSSEKKKFEENSEFILNHIRSVALEYGATIVYTSGKMNSNLNVLYDYICHVLFGFDLVHKPNLMDKEAYFIPSGYDSLPLLQSNDEDKKSLDKQYEEKIPPIVKKTETEEDVQCEDTNTFFETLKSLGIKGKDKILANKLSGKGSFVEYKKNNFDLPDMKNYETNIPSMRNVMNLDDKEKKYEDRKKAIKEQIGIKASFNKKENKGNNIEDAAKKQKVREAMLAKIGKGKLKKPLDKK